MIFLLQLLVRTASILHCTDFFIRHEPKLQVVSAIQAKVLVDDLDN